MSNTTILRLFSFGIISLFMGCGASQTASSTSDRVAVGPDWYDKIPTGDGFIYGRGTAEGGMENSSARAAALLARSDISIKLDLLIENLSDLYLDDTTTSEGNQAKQSFTDVLRQVSSNQIKNGMFETWNSQTYSFVKNDEDRYQSYVVLMLNPVPMVQEMESKLKKAAQSDATARAHYEKKKKLEELDVQATRLLRN